MPAAPPEARPRDDQATRLRALVSALRQDAEPGPTAPRGRADAPVVAPPRCPIPVIAIASGKGGVGKTCLSLSISASLASRGLRITLVDADLGMANADVLCNLVPRRRLDQIFAAGAEANLEAIAIDAPGGFRLVPGASNGPGLTREQRRTLIGSLATLASTSDAIVIDTAAGVGEDVLSLIEAADIGIVIATPEPTSIADAYALIKTLTRRAADQASPPLAVVINQAASAEEAQRAHSRIAQVADRFLGLRLPLLGAVPYDEAIRAAVRARRPLMLSAGAFSSAAALALGPIATRLAAAIHAPQ
jgi:flagellar biosynthesis protein FlhG